MASQTQFTFSGDQAAARALVERVATDLGYRLSTEPSGLLKLERGSLGLTLVIGYWAGKNFHLTYTIGFGSDAEGRLTARVDRNVAGGALKGGALGANKAATEYQALVDAIGNAATQAGLFDSVAVLA
jgi:hypothetical protein